jgi:DNA-binding PadR family transcriptional regulator
MKEAKVSQPVLYILLALATKQRHGYDIMKQVESDSQGQINLGPGTLYGAIKRMLADGWIEEIDNPDKDSRYRRVYRLTSLGQQNLSTELQSYRDTLNLAHHYKLI